MSNGTRKKITNNKEQPAAMVDDTVSPAQTEEKVAVEDDKPADSFYKGSGGCYTLDEQGRIVPATDQGDK